MKFQKLATFVVHLSFYAIIRSYFDTEHEKKSYSLLELLSYILSGIIFYTFISKLIKRIEYDSSDAEEPKNSKITEIPNRKSNNIVSFKNGCVLFALVCSGSFLIHSVLSSTTLEDPKFAINDRISQPRHLSTLNTQYATLIGSIPVKDSNDMVISSNKQLAYLLSYPGLIILDISILSSPKILSTLPLKAFTSISYLTLSQDQKHVFLISENYGLFIVDVQNSANPIFLSATIASNSGANCLTAAISPDKHYAYVAGDQDFFIIDISNLVSPTVVYFQSMAYVLHYQMYFHPTNSNYILASILRLGLRVYDVSARTSVTIVSTEYVNQAGGFNNLALSKDGTRAVLQVTPGSYFNLELFDITTPTSVTKIATTSNDYSLTSIGRLSMSDDGKTVYISGFENGLIIYDITTMTKAQVKGVLFLGSKVRTTLYYSSNVFLVLTTNNAFGVYQGYSTTENAKLIPILRLFDRSTSSSYFSFKHSKINKNLYIGYNTGFCREDSTDPLNFQYIACKSTGVVEHMAFSADDSIIYAVGYLATQVSILDNSNKLVAPTLRSIVNCPTGICKDIATTPDNYLYVVDNAFQILVINAANPASPSIVTTIPGSYNSVLITSDSKTLIFDNSSSVINFYDITVRTSPVFLNSVGGLRPKAVSSDGKYLFSCLTVGLKIFDISDLTNIRSVSSLKTQNCFDLKLHPTASYLYLSDGSAGLKLVDISDIKNPYTVTAFLVPNAYFMEIDPTGTAVYLVDYASNFYVFDISKSIAVPYQNYITLGSSYSKTLEIFQYNNNTLKSFPSLYKFSVCTLYTIDYRSVITYLDLPPWAYFNPATGNLTINPNSPGHIGNYTFIVGISTKIISTKFVGSAGIVTANDASDLFYSLKTSGYIDSDGYLTSKFVPGISLDLDRTYSANEVYYRKVMTVHYFESQIKITVAPSLAFTVDNSSMKINFDSQSKSSITCTVTINSGVLIPVDIGASTTTSNQGKTLVISGLLTDIQLALQNLKIHLNGSSSTDGIITINDGINPVDTLNLTRISDYFGKYNPPVLMYPLYSENKTIQNLGTFTLKIPSDLFTEINQGFSSLIYKLYQVDPVLGLIDLPNYMSFESARNSLVVRSDLTTVTFNSTANSYSSKILIRIIATNKGGLSTSYDFELQIYNTAPVLHIPIQSQVDKSKFTSGSPFSITLASDTFISISNDARLSYNLLTKSDKTTPDWVQFNDLVISGNPPDEGAISIDLKLIASNQYQSKEDYFTLSFKPSATYIINQILTWIGTALGIIGFWAYRITLYNIFLKFNYQFPKRYQITFMSPITNETIYPIAFTAFYENEANSIVKRMLKENPASSYYDIEKGHLDFSRCEIYFDLDNLNPLKKKILKELIKDKMIFKLLNMKEFLKEKKLFSQIKSNWHRVIEYKPSHFDHPLLNTLNSFIVDEKILNSLVQENTNEILTEPSMNLIKEAMLSMARINFNIKEDSSTIKVTGNLIEQTNPISSFLKLNLTQTGENDNLGLGVKSGIDRDTLTFSGDPDIRAINSVIVIQIKRSDDKILREMMVDCKNSSAIEIDQLRKALSRDSERLFYTDNVVDLEKEPVKIQVKTTQP